MSRSGLSIVASLAVGGSLAAAGLCQAQVGQAYRDGSRAGLDTLGQTYNGMGGVVTSPFRDFGVMRAKLPPPLEKARTRPYDVRGLGSCEAVLNEVADLDLVLGPDLDTPDIEHHRNMYGRGADMAASAAVDAVRSAANHFIPMRDTIRKITGADRADKKLAKAVLSGQVRRAFLKSYGMQHNCAWPAAPIGFRPAPGGPDWSLTQAVAPAPPPPAPMMAAVIAAVAPATPLASPPPPPAATEPQAGAWRIGPPQVAQVSTAGLSLNRR